MPLNWPGISNVGGDIPDGERTSIKGQLDRWADEVEAELARRGMGRFTSPIFQPWSLVVVRDQFGSGAAFSPLTGGIAQIAMAEARGGLATVEAVAGVVQRELGREVSAGVRLPKPGAPDEHAAITAAAQQHVDAIEKSTATQRVVGLDVAPHLEQHVRTFLETHPDPDRNVFVMMRFTESEQLEQVYATIRETLSARGLHAVRADDRDYTGELWSNVQVYLTCSNLGIAVFEDIDQRDFNPNVSLELGYMLGQGKRCTILKEQRLPTLPADVLHRLYKSFDAFKIEETVAASIARWVDVDLGIS